jgi:hypothetical protein
MSGSIKGPGRGERRASNEGLQNDEMKGRDRAKRGTDRGGLLKEIQSRGVRGVRRRMDGRSNGGRDTGGRVDLLAAISSRPVSEKKAVAE